jgi:hypothetical protein
MEWLADPWLAWLLATVTLAGGIGLLLWHDARR